MPSRDKLAELTAWCGNQITGDETFRSGTEAQLCLDHLFQAYRLQRPKLSASLLHLLDPPVAIRFP